MKLFRATPYTSKLNTNVIDVLFLKLALTAACGSNFYVKKSSPSCIRSPISPFYALKTDNKSNIVQL